MYNSTEYKNNMKIISKTCTDDLATNCITPLDFHYDYKTDTRKLNDNNKVANNGNSIAIKKFYRPTYGAYSHKTLPRGPYLQYKFNDYQTIQLSEHQFDDNDDNNRLLQLQQKFQDLSKTITATGITKITTNSSTLPRTNNAISTITKPSSHLVQSLPSYQNSIGITNYCTNNRINYENKMPLTEYKSCRFYDDVNGETIADGGDYYYDRLSYNCNNNNHQLVSEKLNSHQQCDIPNSYFSTNTNNSVNTLRNNENLKNYRENLKKQSEINLNRFQQEKYYSKEDNFAKKIHKNNTNMFTQEGITAKTSHISQNNFQNVKRQKNYGNTNIYSMLPKFVSNNVDKFNETKRIVNEINYITLADVIQKRPEGLCEIEGWAILCQAVQALQDMFLSDFPTTSKIVPLVKASTIQITSRGRIVFNITTLSQLDKFNDAISCFNVTDHLSPEYRHSLGKKILFAESDMEKMWIYSLGISLRKAININQFNTEKEQKFSKHNIQQLIRNVFSDYFLSLDEVIECMCKEDIHQRASLMYLLDVISLFCREQKQVKPFSHIVMEIFQSIIELLRTEESDFHTTNIANVVEINQIIDGVKSETDSGRSSAYDGERDSISPCAIDSRKSCLKVRRAEKSSQPIKYDYCGTIGYAEVKYLQNQDIINSNRLNQLQVNRRNRKDILKRRNDFRRNTIDVSLFDIEKAKEAQSSINLNSTKSMECIDRIFSNNESKCKDKINTEKHQQITEGASLPDLCPQPQTLKTFKNAKVQAYSKDTLTKAYSEGNFSEKLFKGPEFVFNSKFSPIKELCITDSKCQHKKAMHVHLLNGQTIKIICNSITTTTHQILESIFQSENYIENFFIGLCALIGGDFVFLPQDLKIYKVAPQAWINTTNKKNSSIVHESPNFTLFIRIKFFLPTLRGISSFESRHMLYLQLRRSILERHILCAENDLITLAGFALQAEIGDFNETMKYNEEYFTISHYLPEGIYHHHNKQEMFKYLRNSHFCRRGLQSKEAEQMFIKYIQDMKEYGFHLYSAVLTTDDGNAIDVYVGISLAGMALFERNCRRHHQLTIQQQQQQPQQQHKLLPSLSTSSSSSLSSSATHIASSQLLLNSEINKNQSNNNNNTNNQNNKNNNKNSKLTYQRRLYMSFEWLEIENLCYSKHILCIAVRKTESLKAKDKNRIKYKLKMDGRKSYFAFSLASDHHQFYMKLRNSFISLKTLSTELNIPITFGVLKDKNFEIDSPAYQQIIEMTTIPSMTTTTTTVTTSSLSSSSPLLTTTTAKSSSSSLVSSKNPKTIADVETTMTTMNDANKNLEQKIQSNHIVYENPLPSESENFKKIDKQSKSSGLRVKNLKKSMLNDNRLMKLKDRILKRSKSTAGTIIEKVTTVITHQQQQQNKNHKNEKQYCRELKDMACKINDEKDRIRKDDADGDVNDCGNGNGNDSDNINNGTKEENQNKENECPIKVHLKENESLTKAVVCSPSRNRVKMGTRVFSSQFLNKSLDNIYDSGTVNICQFESVNSVVKESIDYVGDNHPSNNDGYDCNENEIDIEKKIIEFNDNNQLLLNTSHNSLYFVEKSSNLNNKLYDSISPATEAFVIQTSIKSDRDLHDNFTLPNETVSESLLEKFTNISCCSDINDDRMLVKLTVVKERLNRHQSCNENNHEIEVSSIKDNVHSGAFCSQSIIDINNAKDAVKYATFNGRLVKENHENNVFAEKNRYRDTNSKKHNHNNNNNNNDNNINIDSMKIHSSSSTLNAWLPSHMSQESISINNKFQTDENVDNNVMKEEMNGKVLAINHKNMENDLDGFTLGISIVQGSDNNVYVKDLVKNGPGDKAGVHIGDQIVAVNGISLLNLSYAEALKKLQNTGLIVELIVSQLLDSKTCNTPEVKIQSKSSVLNTSGIKHFDCKTYKSINRSQSNIIINSSSNKNRTCTHNNKDNDGNYGNASSSTPLSSHNVKYQKQIKFTMDDINYRPINNNDMNEIQSKRPYNTMTPAKSMPDLPKVVAIIPKRVIKAGDKNKLTYPRTMGNSRKYFGPLRYPVTPYKTTIISPHKQQLSLLADSDDDQEVYI